MIKIPVRNLVAQRFNLEIVAEDKILVFEIFYNSRGQFFTMSLTHSNAPLIVGVKLVSGTPLFRQFNILVGDFIIVNSTSKLDDPKLGDFDTSCELFYFEKSELEQLEV